MIKKLVYFVIITLLISCKTDDGIPDCSAVLCAIPSITINLVDDTTNDNIILKNNITQESIHIKDTDDNTISFHLKETDGSIFADRHIGANTYTLLIDSEIISKLSYDTSAPNTTKCCDVGDLINVNVENDTFKVESDTLTIYL